jgi:hypothetical protein
MEDALAKPALNSDKQHNATSVVAKKRKSDYSEDVFWLPVVCGILSSMPGVASPGILF